MGIFIDLIDRDSHSITISLFRNPYRPKINIIMLAKPNNKLVVLKVILLNFII